MKNFSETSALKSNFSPDAYASIEKQFNSVTSHVRTLCEHIQKRIVPYIDNKRFLDIGAGPGFVIHELLDYFNTVVAVDPNDSYASCYSTLSLVDKFTIINKNFESVNFNKKFDFILCSHVLYHVPQNDWSVFIDKIIQLLSPKGRALLTLVAPRGEFHHLCNQINDKYSNSQVLQARLNDIGLKYKISKVRNSYFYKSIYEITNLLRMFVIDDCFLPEEYSSLGQDKIVAIDQQIGKFVDKCYESEKDIYTFEIEEDYIELHV